MKRHLLLFVMITGSTLACGKILKKNERSSGDATVAAATDDTASSGDATAAEKIETKETKVDNAAAALNGKELYAKLCASCHQTLEKTDVPKAPLAKIQDALQKQVDMASLKGTTEKDLTAIAEALKTVSKGKGNGEED